MPSKFLLLLCFFTLFSACSSITTQSEINEREKAQSLVADSFPQEYPIVLHPVKNKSKNADVDYLEKAIPDIIEGLLNPTKKEFAYIDLSKYVPKIPKSLDALVTGTNTIFKDYITNQETQQTQFLAILSTNSNSVLSGNTNILVIKITTNAVQTNTYLTNLPYFDKTKYYTFITNEFTGLIDKLSYIPVSVKNQSRLTNTAGATNDRAPEFFMDISGEFKIVSKGSGPNTLNITLKVLYVNEITNRKELSISCREDQVSDRIRNVLKDLRQDFLNRKNGDLIIVSDPEEANIYLDGSYIGKSPLYYPAVIDGPHQIVLLKEGYKQGNVRLQVIADKTNLITTTISSWELGGEILIESKPEKAQVFVDSLFRGTTPLSLTNLELKQEHRVKIVTDQKGFKPYYKNFYLSEADQKVKIKATLKDYEGSHATKKKNAWILTYSSWGLTIGIIGLNIYSHYQSEHYLDLFHAYGTDIYQTQYSSFAALKSGSLTAGILSGIVSGLVTAYALSTENIFLGMDLQKDNTTAIFGVRF